MAPRRIRLGDRRPVPLVDTEDLAARLRPLGSARRLSLLAFLLHPRYLEEIASYLGVARQTADRHVDALLETGVIRSHQGTRASGPVVEYVLVPDRLFALGEELQELGSMDVETLEAPHRPTEQPETPRNPPPQVQRPALVVVHGGEPGTAYVLPEGGGPWGIGRDSSMAVNLPHDLSVSNKHAQLVEAGETHVLIDLFSTNGTHVNWEPLAGGEERPLRSGDVVSVGRTRLVYWD